MSKASALAAAQGTAAPAPAAPAPAGSGYVSARQAARVPVPKADATPGAAPVVGAAPNPTAPPAVAPTKEQLDSDRFAHLAKKEVELQKQREAFKTERAQLEAEKAKFAEAGKKFQGFEELKAKDPLAAMRLAGFTDTDIFNFYAKAEQDKKAADSPEAKAVAAAEAKIKEFEDRQAKAAQDAKTAQDNQTIKQFQGKISQTVAADKDKYEFCNFHGPTAEALIYETVESVFKESGEVLSPSEAADMVEKYYEDQAKAQQALKKLGAKSPEPAPKAPAPAPAPSKTLTNRVAATVSSTIPVKESPAEKRERLINQIKEHGLRK